MKFRSGGFLRIIYPDVGLLARHILLRLPSVPINFLTTHERLLAAFQDRADDFLRFLCVDGATVSYVRLYHGKLTDLPRRYVARDRLCLRGTTDYWINAMDGAPFFVVTRPVDDGLIRVHRATVMALMLRGQVQPYAMQEVGNGRDQFLFSVEAVEIVTRLDSIDQGGKAFGQVHGSITPRAGRDTSGSLQKLC